MLSINLALLVGTAFAIGDVCLCETIVFHPVYTDDCIGSNAKDKAIAVEISPCTTTPWCALVAAGKPVVNIVFVPSENVSSIHMKLEVGGKLTKPGEWKVLQNSSFDFCVTPDLCPLKPGVQTAVADQLSFQNNDPRVCTNELILRISLLTGSGRPFLCVKIPFNV